MVETSITDKSALRTRTLKGAAWSAAAKFFRQFIQLFFQILLARMLAPADFGLLSMILVFSALADILKNMGLGSAIIQRADITPNHLNTVFWMNTMSGLILFLLFQLVAPLIASFYNTPAIESVTRVYAVIYLVGSLNVVQEALMHKELQFKRLFFIEASAVLISGVLALVLAWYNYGVWTLVGQYLCISLITTIVLWITSPWRPKLSFSKQSLKDLHKYGRNLLGHDLLSFVSRNIDNLFIGRYLGASALGIYSRAYFLMLQPINITSQVLARVMFPVFSTMQHDHAYIRTMYLKSTRLVAFIVFPGIVYVFVMASPLINLLLGDKWSEVAFILQVFCVYSLVDTIGVTTGWIYKSLGRTDMMLRWAIYSTVIIISSIIAGLYWGIEGVALSYTICFFIFLWLPGWYFAFRLIDLRVTEMLLNLVPVFVAASVAGIGMATLKYWIGTYMANWLVCLLIFISGAIIYFILSRFTDKASVSFFKNLAGSFLRRIFFRKRKLSID